MFALRKTTSNCCARLQYLKPGVPAVARRPQASVARAIEQLSPMSSTDDLSNAEGKLKMLCLHGFLQNSDIFRMRIGSMRKSLKSRVHFLFQDAPFHAASTLTEQQIKQVGGSSDGLTWFQWTDLGPDKRPSLAVKYSNWEQTYSTLCTALKQQQPDGLFGFSQGATAAALFLAALQTAHREGRDLDVPLPKFCIVCAGFYPRDPEYADLLKQAQVNVPTLFIIGETDKLIPPERSHQLMDTFDHSTADMFVHPGAHMVPTCTGEFKQQMVAFLDRFRGSGMKSVGASATSLDESVTASDVEEVAAAVGRL